MSPEPNQPASVDAPIASLLHIVHQGRRATEHGRSANVLAERAKLKSRGDDMIVAQGKRSAALGNGSRMNTSLF